MMTQHRPPLLLLGILLSSLASPAQAASGTWTNGNGGSWTNAQNWSNGAIASGAGSTANFSTLSLLADTVVTLDAPLTVANMGFDDKSAPSHRWILEPGAAGQLRLDGTSPTLTVLNSPTVVRVPVFGTAGLTKTGAGQLTLAGGAAYSGTTVVNGGTLDITNATFSAASPLKIASPGSVVESTGTLNLEVNTSGTAIAVTGSGTLRFVSTNSSAAMPDIYFGPNHSANTCWSARLAAAVDLGSAQRYVFGKTGHNGVGPYGLTGADCQFAGSISGSGGLTFIAQNTWTASGPMEVPFALNAANTFTGPIEIRRGSVYLGHADALGQGNPLTFNPASGHNARLFLYGRDASVSDLSSEGPGSAIIANGNLKTGATVTLGAATLSVTQNLNGTFGGVITDVYPEYTGSGSGSTGPLNLSKSGTGRLTLTGASSYSGTTVVAGGTLQVDGALGPTSLTIGDGATLSGTGEINGPVSVQAGGKLEPGAADPGTLIIRQSVSLSGTTLMKLSKTGTTLSSDRLGGMTALSCGGTLVVTNVGDVRTGALAAGDSFTLFEAQSRAGSFSSLTLPPLSAGLEWYTANLATAGSITVIDSAAPPIITKQPQSLTISEGATAAFSAGVAGTGPLTFQWLRNGAPIASATTTTYTLQNATTNDLGGYNLAASNYYGSVTSLVAALTVIPAGLETPVTNGLRVYLNFDNNVNAQAGTTVQGTIYTGGAAYGPRYRTGVIGSAATFSNTSNAGQPDDWALSLGNLETIYSGSFSISLWQRNTTIGDGALLGNKNWTSGANVGWVISTLDPKNLNYNAVGGTRRDIDLNPPFSDGNWHLVTITFDRDVNVVTSYVDAVPVASTDISPSATASFDAGFPTLVGSSGNGTYSGTGDLDDLGIWNRVLTPEEITGIYGAGLSGRPLTLAVPGMSPAITAQPQDLNVASGLDVVFSVTASGPGPLTYQWRLNGINIPGATNSTLVLTAVTAAGEGLYTVLVSNGSGAIISSGAYLSVYTLAVTGQWDFESANLQATVGAELELEGSARDRISFPLVTIDSQEARVLAIGNSPTNGAIYVRHGIKPNGGGRFVNQYTLLMDVLFPPPNGSQPHALLETQPFDLSAENPELYAGDNPASPGSYGLGAEGQLAGVVLPNNWYRVALAVDLTAPQGQQLKTYINGSNAGVQALSGGIDGRYALGPAVLLFPTSKENTQPVLVNSIQFVNGCLSPDAIEALGGPTPSGLPPGNAALRIESLTQNASTLTLKWSGPDGQILLQKSNTLTDPVWQDVARFTNSRTITVQLAEPRVFYRVVKSEPEIVVGQLPNGEQSVPSKQILRAAGQQLEFGGRPVDIMLSPDGKQVYVKNLNNLLVLDSLSWKLKQTLGFPGAGASMHGIAVAPDGSRVYVTGAGNELYEWAVTTNGVVSFSRTIVLPGGSYPCGVAVTADGTRAYVCLSIANRLCEVDLRTGSVVRQINVGIAPWDVALSAAGNTAYVSDWGGRFPVTGEATAPSAGTAVVIDQRGVAASGAVSFVDLSNGIEVAQLPTGLHPSDLELAADGNSLYVANANSDTINVVDTQTRAIRETILVRPDPTFPYGSAADGLALSRDGRMLFAASAGNNAVAVIELPNAVHTNSTLLGFLPTDWYPGALVVDDQHLYVANVKGLGTRQGQPETTTWQINAFLGTANKIPLPDRETLAKYTAQVFEDGRIREIRKAYQPPESAKPAVPVPERCGEPSVFKHVLYVLKENKTYDQVFGDLPQGNGEPNLCIYPRFVTPNHHALAEQYVLLDNFYCNGVNSSDGHSWSTEGNVTDHLEKSFGGFSRSYTFGDDPLTYSSTGFIWNNVLEHGLSFRNYGEMDYASPSPPASWLEIYNDFMSGAGKIRYVQNIGIASLRPFSSTNVPGWNMGIPDVVRAAGFIKELNQAQARGSWESFHLLYLPNDHTGGPPSPRAQVADNDLALGQVVEAVTKSIFGSNTVIFVIEDDPQSGYDHVDAHRSLCLVISPYTKRHKVVSAFYNQAGVLHTMERILGLPPMNQQDAMAPLMFDCFTDTPDFTPFTALANNVQLTEGVVALRAPVTPKDRYWAKQLERMDFSRPDRIDDDLFNRYIWYTIRGEAPYPAWFVGGHGRGLKQLGLALDRQADKDDDDE